MDDLLSVAWDSVEPSKGPPDVSWQKPLEIVTPNKIQSVNDVEPSSLNVRGRLYVPIKPWQSRIVCLYPGKASDTIRASLHRVVLIHSAIEGLLLSSHDEAISYEALSYTWGVPDPENQYEIVLNNVKISVTRNLYNALLDLRSLEHPRWLWIDAICINQNDLDEKAQQVRNMYAIYQKASRVIVWLGLSSRGARLAAEWLKAVALDWPDRILPFDAFDRAGSRTDELLRPSNESYHPFKNHSQYERYNRKDIFRGLEEMAESRWMRRIWVVQEVHAARAVTVSCASVSLKWDEFSYLQLGLEVLKDQETAHNLRESTENGIEALETINAVALSRFPSSLMSGTNLSLVEPPVRLLELTEYFQRSEATIPHDKIYALLTMASVKVKPGSNRPPADDEIEVDYRISLTELFRRVTAYLISSFASLELLLSNRKIPSARSASWARDFRVSGLQEVNYFTLFQDEREITSHLSFAQSSLKAKGHILGTIHKVMDVLLVKEVGTYHLCQNSELHHVEVTEASPAKLESKRVYAIYSQPTEPPQWKRGPKRFYFEYRNDSDPQKYINAGATIWLATNAARLGDFVVKLCGSACPVVLRLHSPSQYSYVGGIRPLVAGQVPVSGTQKGAIRVGFESGEGYYDIRRDLPWDEWELEDIWII